MQTLPTIRLEDSLSPIVTELWSEDKKDLEIKAKIISDCAYLPEFFPEFPDKDLPKEELNKYMDNFVEILTDKAETIYSTNREKNIVRVFFTIYWKQLSNNPKVKMYCISYLCAEYFRKSKKDRTDNVLKHFQTFFNAFFTKDRILKLKKEYPGTIYSNIIKKNYELN